MLRAKPVTAESAELWKGPGVRRVTAANGKPIAAEPGQWVVTYGPGDVAVMDEGEFRRLFGHVDA